MVVIWIDNLKIEVAEGVSILSAARKLGIDLPALCYQEGQPANNACMCCLVRVDDKEGLVPACSTPVRAGMRVESETQAIRELRRTGIELLLADHAGDCHAPCENTCPAGMDVPDMLRQAATGDYRAAIETVKRDIALPAILGRVCPEVCEGACRRGQHDSPAAICKIKRYVADKDLASPSPYQPPTAPPTGKRVAIVGGGPTGLTATYHLSQQGHQCTLIEQRAELGGRLGEEFSRDKLPRKILEHEAEAALALGTTRRLGQCLGEQIAVEELVCEFDAVLLATGRFLVNRLDTAGIQTTTSGIRVDSHSRMTSREGMFAAGNAVRPYNLVVQSVAEGKLAAQCIDAWLRGISIPDRRHKFETRLARLSAGELCDFCEGAPTTARLDDRLRVEDLSEDDVRQEAERCLSCDCPALDTCRLHHYAAMYHCDAQRFRGNERRFEGRIVGQRVVLELGKCILCGICVQLARETSDAVGLTFLGRSLETRIGPPPGVTLDQALGSAALRCADACPTGAITFNR
ncbi:FAD-dependent oxidoreductase [Bythopirellula polymerisocia]|uniref:NAD-dependent dihydropyrimidine dehydrogenase subunit PreT n=1 Tax=Bythopirellula polymerisocia TaxID=2528003 RepID=A0A5C6CV00_9BACT|nr:FAD-dependent oxidoreductase [Bythopirellula polymerisocia]TWU28382.1 NAD-dependent dihydropyrimidine dehydrogenase subunit PreT [Bythopirellula polymerisocia]